MVLPLIAGICLFLVYPAVKGLLISFFDVYKVTDSLDRFIGLKNFKELFRDQIFLNSVKTMFILQIPRTIINFSVPFIYAELLFLVKNSKLQATYRIIILLPMVCPGVVVTLIWRYLYAYDGGAFNEILTSLRIIDKNIDFLGAEHIIPSLIFMGFPWLPATAALIVLSGLLSIPPEILEASRIEGCGTLRRIFTIDAAFLIGQIKYFLVFGIIGLFQDYSNQLLFADKVGTTIYVPAYYMYRLVNTNQSIGKASGIGVMLFLVIMLITACTYRFLNKQEAGNEL